ncbi:ArsR family transcriptional regulator [Candidatus Arcticimaribacter forsetii]|uniref:ArsR family transcriptional regulator n=1 Tax=Candidatus Arcticimaribacter forsetii TaxID=2820661 RepID=UPI0020778BF2|nr:ArsR family transcriptional regulator [Candidatus Arcticimaribacter forsetii]MDB2330024.1 ArsR family transcriptional regulator [Flavobacteriaceae bacterium]MDB4674034.1 ArsR family transcriptional regulator [Flavobacteriaceae bacterium]
MLNKLITSKTRLRLLIKFFINQANSGYLNGLASEFNESTNSIRKELNHLSEAGYLQKYKDHNKVGYKANTGHPLFDMLQKVVHKHLGLEEIVERVLERMGPVQKILLVGDYAEGLDSGTIDVVLIGNKLNTEYIEALEEKIEGVIDRKVNFYLASKPNPNQKHIVLYESH